MQQALHVDVRSRRQMKWIHTSPVVGCRRDHWWTMCSPTIAEPWTTRVKSALENLLHSATYRKTCLGASLRHKSRVTLLSDAWARGYHSICGILLQQIAESYLLAHASLSNLALASRPMHSYHHHHHHHPRISSRYKSWTKLQGR